MTLEFKHIASYLPYNLKVQWTLNHEKNTNLLVGIIKYEPDNYFADGLTWFLEMEEDDIMPFGTHQCRPILKPLSCLTIEDAREHNYVDEGHLERSLLSGHASYDVWIHFAEKHYDVFDLISHGLAVNINDLDN